MTVSQSDYSNALGAGTSKQDRRRHSLSQAPRTEDEKQLPQYELDRRDFEAVKDQMGCKP